MLMKTTKDKGSQNSQDIFVVEEEEEEEEEAEADKSTRDNDVIPEVELDDETRVGS